MKEVKGKVNIHSTENRRIPQNLMSKNSLPWVHNGVVRFAVSPKPRDGKLTFKKYIYLINSHKNVALECSLSHTVIILKIRQTSFGKLNFLVEFLEENCHVPV